MPSLQTFNPSPDFGGGLGPLATLYIVGLIAVHVATAYFVFAAASRMSSDGRGSMSSDSENDS